MSPIHTWVCFLLWISFSTQDKTPDATVTCFVSEQCVLPCTFQPDNKATIQWFRQDVLVYKFRHDRDEDSSSEEQFAGDLSVFPNLVSRGNASLMLKKTSLKERGTYRCHVNTSDSEHSAKIILKVEAPIRDLSLILSGMSGYKEMICTVNNVYPAPRVTWATEPSTFEDLRPVTRMNANKQGLYTVDSRLRLLNGQPNLIYICRVTSSYGGPARNTSLREREIKGSEGKDLTIPCFAPYNMKKPSLEWSFTNSLSHSHILTYDSESGHSTSTPPWEHHVELNGYRVPFGDGSLRLMDPNSKHTGSYSCVFATPFNTHTERTEVMITGPDGGVSGGRSEPHEQKKSSHWWIAGLLIAALILGLVALLAYLKTKGYIGGKPRKNLDGSDPEEVAELNVVRDATSESKVSENSLLNAGHNEAS